MADIAGNDTAFRSRLGDAFWQRSGGAAMDFLNFADFDDWVGTLKAIADVIADQCAATPALQAADAPRMLDFGCGFAHSLRDIINLLAWRHRLVSRWYAYDPDLDIIKLLEQKLLSPLAHRHNFPGVIMYTDKLTHIVGQAQSSLAFIMFMHTIYYVDDAVRCLRYCFDRLLHPDGYVLVLMLSEDSPFYVLNEFLPDNGLNRVAREFTVIHRIPRTMRFSIPRQLLQDELFVAEMFHLMSRGRIEISTRLDVFRREFRRLFSKVVDLKDEILVLRR